MLNLCCNTNSVAASRSLLVWYDFATSFAITAHHRFNAAFRPLGSVHDGGKVETGERPGAMGGAGMALDAVSTDDEVRERRRLMDRL